MGAGACEDMRRRHEYSGLKPGDRIINKESGKHGVISSWMLPSEPRRGVWIKYDDDPETKIDVGRPNQYLKLES